MDTSKGMGGYIGDGHAVYKIVWRLFNCSFVLRHPFLLQRYFPKENETAENKAEEDGEDMYHNLEDLVGQCLRYAQVKQYG